MFNHFLGVAAAPWWFVDASWFGIWGMINFWLWGETVRILFETCVTCSSCSSNNNLGCLHWNILYKQHCCRQCFKFGTSHQVMFFSTCFSCSNCANKCQVSSASSRITWTSWKAASRAPGSRRIEVWAVWTPTFGRRWACCLWWIIWMKLERSCRWMMLVGKLKMRTGLLDETRETCDLYEYSVRTVSGGLWLKKRKEKSDKSQWMLSYVLFFSIRFCASFMFQLGFEFWNFHTHI